MYIHEQSTANTVYGTAMFPADKSLILKLLHLVFRYWGEQIILNLTGVFAKIGAWFVDDFLKTFIAKTPISHIFNKKVKKNISDLCT